jgi:hypothetical protein
MRHVWRPIAELRRNAVLNGAIAMTTESDGVEQADKLPLDFPANPGAIPCKADKT